MERFLNMETGFNSLTDMIKNYFKTALRNMLRNKTFSMITIFGLAGGLTCAMLILTFVSDELSYDKFHSNKDRIYRLRYKISDFDIARVPPIFKEHLNDYFPEVEASTRMYSRGVSVKVPTLTGAEEKRFEEENVNFVDPEIFQIFDFELVRGDLSGALQKPFTVILNEEISKKYFGDENAIGKSILMEGSHSFMVTAVVKDFPSNSHVHFDMLLPYDNMYDLEPTSLQEPIRNNFKLNWMVSHSPTYVLLKEGSTAASVNERFPEFVKEKIPEGQQKGQTFEIQPLLDIHLNSDVVAQAEPPGSLDFIYIFIAVGILTLIIACINFVNLSTAKSLDREKEIGMRKVMGAGRGSLVSQFLGESFLTTLIAAVISVWFTMLLLPQLNNLTNKELTIGVLNEPIVMIGFAFMVIITSLLAGLYPSFFVSRFQALKNLKGMAKTGKDNLSFRKGLIIVQFIISIVLISSTLIVFEQLDLLRNKPLGFNKDHMITVPLQSNNFNAVFGGSDEAKLSKLASFEEEIATIPGVLASTLSSTPPGFGMVNRNIIPEGFTAEDNMLSPVMSVDYDLIETYGMELVAGRSFSKAYGSDQQEAFVINEKAVQDFNFGTPEEALGKEIWLEGKEAKVIGVVKDFNFVSLSQAIRPIILEISPAQYSFFSIKLQNSNIPETLDAIESKWNAIFPNETFSHSFLDESLADNYETQENFGKLIGYFAILAIFISCLGSYGLIMFIASQKKKEVGVRKVLGASITQVVYLLSRRFVILVFVSIALAIPITIYAANMWLDNFYYRIDISPLSIILASLATVALVLLTVSMQSFKAATMNPASALRSE